MTLIPLKLLFLLGGISAPITFFITKYETAKRKRGAGVDLSKFGIKASERVLLLQVEGKGSNQVVKGVGLTTLNNGQKELRKEDGRRTGLKRINVKNGCNKQQTIHVEHWYSGTNFDNSSYLDSIQLNKNNDINYYYFDPSYIKVQGTKVKTKDNQSLNWTNLHSLPFKIQITK